MQEETIKEKEENKQNMDKTKKANEDNETQIEDKQDEAASSIHALEKEIKELKEENEKLENEKKETYQKYLISLADKENYRKRYEKEKNEAIRFSNEKLFKELLPVLDSLEKAMSEKTVNNKADSENSQATVEEGFFLVDKKLRSTLKSHGLETVAAEPGEDFDPHFHQAIQKEESEAVSKSVIKEEFMRGYKLYKHLLRPSIVSVLIPKEDKDDPQTEG